MKEKDYDNHRDSFSSAEENSIYFADKRRFSIHRFSQRNVYDSHRKQRYKTRCDMEPNKMAIVSFSTAYGPNVTSVNVPFQNTKIQRSNLQHLDVWRTVIDIKGKFGSYNSNITDDLCL